MRRAAGFTLLEFIFTLVILAALTRIAMARITSPAALTLEPQAQQLADFVRRAQSVAMARGQRVRVSVTASGSNGSISMVCTTGSTPCNTDQTLIFEQGVSLAGNTPVLFNSFGVPLDNVTGLARNTGVSFTLGHSSAGPNSHTVTVAPLTGRVSVSP